jgi:hypothetical protein
MFKSLFCRHKEKKLLLKYYKDESNKDYYIVSHRVYKCNRCGKIIDIKIDSTYISIYFPNAKQTLCNVLKARGYMDYSEAVLNEENDIIFLK